MLPIRCTVAFFTWATAKSFARWLLLLVKPISRKMKVIFFILHKKYTERERERETESEWE